MTDEVVQQITRRVQELLTGADHLPADREPHVFDSPAEEQEFVLDGVYRRAEGTVGQVIEQSLRALWEDEPTALEIALANLRDIDMAALKIGLLQLEARALANEVMSIRLRSSRNDERYQ